MGAHDGVLNVGIGTHILQNNESGSRNIAIGEHAMRNVTSGDYNVALGYSAASGAATGDKNVALGYHAFSRIKAASHNNIVIGDFNSMDSNHLEEGSYNILIGSRANPSSSTASYNLNIGNTIFGNLEAGQRGISIGTRTIDDLVDTNLGPAKLSLDVEGPIGATHYCDENGDNCVDGSELNALPDCVEGQILEATATPGEFACSNLIYPQ